MNRPGSSPRIIFLEKPYYLLRLLHIPCILNSSKLRLFQKAVLYGEPMIEIDSKKRVEIIDITRSVENAIAESGVESGICLIYTLHTTTGITINEDESGLIQDIMKLMESLVPERAGYMHDRSDGNADAHLRAVLLGNSVAVPVEKGRPVLGTWQRILFIELDGPRHRRIYVKAIPD